MTIAVLDDGINPGRYPCIRKMAFDLRINQSGRIFQRRKQESSSQSHGTTCAAIIQKYAPDAELGSIQVLQDDSGRGYPKQLITALHWCAERQIPLIQMSIGSRLLWDVEPIRTAVQEVLESGTVIVAALANTNRFSVPACMEGVIGVRTSSIMEGDQYAPIEGGLFEVAFAASSRHELTDYAGETHITSICNSFAAPLITAKVYDLLKKEPFLSGSECIAKLGGHSSTIWERIQRTPFELYPRAEVPIIQMIGKPQETHPLIHRLRSCFQKFGYSCLALAEEIGDFENCRRPREVPLPQYLGYLSRMLEPDLFLIASTQAKEFVDCSIYVHANLKNTRYCREDIYMPAQVTDLVISRIVRHLEKQGD